MILVVATRGRMNILISERVNIHTGGRMNLIATRLGSQLNHTECKQKPSTLAIMT